MSRSADQRFEETLRQAAASGEECRLAKVWRTRLKSLRSLNLLETLHWSADITSDGVTLDALDELRHQSRRKAARGKLTANEEELYSGTVEAWLEHQSLATSLGLLEQLLACDLMLQSASRLSDRVLLRLWRSIEEHTGQFGATPNRHHSAVRELLAIELQFLQQIVCSGVAPTASDVGPVVEAISQFLSLFTDGQGRPAAEIHESLPMALTSLARIRQVIEKLDLTWLDSDDQRRLGVLAETSVLLFPNDCSWISLATPQEAYDWVKCVATLNDRHTSDIIGQFQKHWKRAALDLDERPTRTSHKRKAGKSSVLKKKQLVSHQSDAAKYGLMTGNWRESRDHAVVRYHSESPAIEVAVLDRQLFQGSWEMQVSAGGNTWRAGDWSCCCWYSDPEADFCELKWDISPQVTAYRQLLWARQEQFLLIADEVRAAGLSGITIEARLPVAPGWTVLADGRTREWQLHQGDAAIRVLPIFAPVEKVHSCDDHLSCGAQSIISRTGAGESSIYNAFVLDWNVKRTALPAHWGRVTVAEDGQRISSSLASAARWRMGDKLWMVFHQPEKGDSARSALGLHTHHETVIARVADGEYHTLVEVE